MQSEIWMRKLVSTKYPGSGEWQHVDAQVALLATDPDQLNSTDEDGVFNRPPPSIGNYFSDRQRRILGVVLSCLFPEDGNGPGARDLNALPYLEWAMSEPVNLRDGDPEFIVKGIGWLDEVSQATHGDCFVGLTQDLQDAVMQRLAETKSGENWLSLLMFYLTEALTLDPYYGGNPDMIGWMWLDHRPGFPRPVPGKSYRDFE
jgi:gluconate 2-dehydrogenase gamma chain